jgi:hypothetical protein
MGQVGQELRCLPLDFHPNGHVRPHFSLSAGLGKRPSPDAETGGQI